MSDKLAVLMEFNGYTKDELEAYLSLKFGSMTKGGMTASILSQSGYEKAKSVIFGQPQLNENQQIVLDYLKEIAKEGVSPMLGMEFLKYELGQNEYSGFRASAVGGAFYEFNNKEEAQVLQAFSQWALEQEED